MDIEALKVELATISLKPGDAILVRPLRELTDGHEYGALVGWAGMVEKILGVPVIVGAPAVTLEIVRKESA